MCSLILQPMYCTCVAFRILVCVDSTSTRNFLLKIYFASKLTWCININLEYYLRSKVHFSFKSKRLWSIINWKIPSLLLHRVNSITTYQKCQRNHFQRSFSIKSTVEPCYCPLVLKIHHKMPNQTVIPSFCTCSLFTDPNISLPCSFLGPLQTQFSHKQLQIYSSFWMWGCGNRNIVMSSSWLRKKKNKNNIYIYM